MMMVVMLMMILLMSLVLLTMNNDDFGAAVGAAVSAAVGAADAVTATVQCHPFVGVNEEAASAIHPICRCAILVRPCVCVCQDIA